jgi:hypothetical protein
VYVWQESIVDEGGRLRPNAHITVLDAATLAPATIYADVDGITEKDNPFKTDAGFGRFYAAPGRYQVTASDDSLERVYEDVQLGVTVDTLPDLSSIIAPLAVTLAQPTLDEAAERIAATHDLVRFTVFGNGTSEGVPVGWAAFRLSPGIYRIVHDRDTLDYTVKLTVWDPASGDRLYSAMMELQQLEDRFEYTVRSIHDEASLSDARVDVEVTFPPS